MRKFTLIMIAALASITLFSSCGSQSTDAKNYEIYPTQNMFNFILLDTYTGRSWQVQWSTEAKNRGIIAEIE